MSDQHLHDFHNYSASNESREIFLHNYYDSNVEENPGVEYRMSVNFLKNLRALELQNNEEILIHMHSVGGEWTDGMAIFDAIRMAKSKVTIIAYGQAESMSSIILQAANKRWMTPNTYFMSHFGSSGAGGGYLDVQNWMKYEKQICDVMLDVYANRCKRGKYFIEKYGRNPDLEKIKTFLYRKLKSGDWYIGAEEAVYYGFADKVVKSW
jgi:ATP-dependent protease ClpP protease subunit